MKAWEVSAWAWSVPVATSAERMVLVAYAWRAGTSLRAWIGLEKLEEDTLLYRETISAARRQLVLRGYLIDTGERRGDTGRVTLYRLGINERQKPPIEPVDNPHQSAAKAADCSAPMSGISRINQRQKPPTTPLSDFEQSQNSSSAHAREPVPGAEAPTLEQSPCAAVRIEGLESPIEKIRRAMPHLTNILPPERTP